MKREGISIEIKNTNIDRTAREELLAGGGKTMVPCLRMQEDGIRDVERSRGLGDVYKRQVQG